MSAISSAKAAISSAVRNVAEKWLSTCVIVASIRSAARRRRASSAPGNASAIKVRMRAVPS